MLTPTEVRLTLKAAGFSLVALNGKRPLSDDWQTKLDMSEDDIRRMPGSNTGVLTRGVPTLDIDITHQEAADYVEDLIEHRYKERGQVLVRFGNRPKRAIPFRTDVPFRKIKVKFEEGAIEFLADGQQFVVDGKHPDTGSRYVWAEYAPWDIERDDLPPIDENEAHELVEYLADALAEEFGFKRVQGNSLVTLGNGHKLDQEMRFGNVHDAQLAQTASLLRQGVCVDEAVRAVETQALQPAGWRWEREEHGLYRMCFDMAVLIVHHSGLEGGR